VIRKVLIEMRDMLKEVYLSFNWEAIRHGIYACIFVFIVGSLIACLAVGTLLLFCYLLGSQLAGFLAALVFYLFFCFILKAIIRVQTR
jgi:hypothetical protein